MNRRLANVKRQVFRIFPVLILGSVFALVAQTRLLQNLTLNSLKVVTNGPAAIESNGICSLEEIPVYNSLAEFIAVEGSIDSLSCNTDSSTFAFIGEISDGLNCPETITRMYSVADSCDNSDTLHQSFIIDDSIPPHLISPGEIMNLCLAEDIPPPYSSLADFLSAGGEASDNCQIDVMSFTMISEVSDGQRCPEIVKRIYQVSDLCGNTDTCLQRIFVHDNEIPVLSPPSPISVECSVNQAPPFISLEEFILAGGDTSDNCAVDPSSFALITEVTDKQQCPEVVTRTYQIKDLCGNAATCDHIIIIHDKLAPDLTGKKQDVYICRVADIPPYQNFAEFLADGGYAKDYCKIDSSSFRLVGELTDDKACPLTITRIYVIEDLCGNQGTYYQDIIIGDTTKPEIVAPPSLSAICSDEEIAVFSSLDQFVTAGGHVSDNCELDESSFSYTGQMSDAKSCPETVTRIYRIADKCGNIDTCHHLIVIHDVEDPVIHPPDDFTVTCSISEIPAYGLNSFVAAGGTVMDNCGIDSSSFLLLSQTTDHSVCPEMVTRIYGISDLCGNMDTCIHRILIDDRQSPMLESPEDLVTTCSIEALPSYKTLTMFLEAGGMVYDNCNLDTGSFRLLTEDHNGESCPETVFRIYQITDMCGNADTCIQRIVIEDLELPLIDAPEDLYTDCSIQDVNPYSDLNTFLSVGGVVSDNCMIEPLSFKLVSEVSDNGKCPETVTRIYQISDLCGNTDTCTQKIIINDIERPKLSSPADLVVTCSIEKVIPYETLSKFIAAGGKVSDNCGIKVESFQLISEESDSKHCPETVTRIYRISDICGNLDTCVQRIRIIDVEAPILKGPEALVAICSSDEIPSYKNLTEFVNAGGEVSDNCKVDVESFRLVSEKSDNQHCPETLTRIYQISDLCGNVDTCIHHIVIDDNEPPLLESPEDLVAICSSDELPAYNNLTEFLNAGGEVSDNCTVNVASFRLVSEKTDNQRCPETVTRIYQIEDLCGNIDTCVHRISIDDQEPPIMESPGNLKTTCSISKVPSYGNLSEFIAAGGRVNDNCSVDPSSFKLLSEESNGQHCPETVTRIYQITDLCGNTDTCIQSIVIEDTQPPIMANPADMLATCSIGEIPSFKRLTEFIVAGGRVTDNCGIDVESFKLVSEVSDTKVCPETLIRVYQIADRCGNTDTCIHRIVIIDEEPPVLVSPGDVAATCFSVEIPIYSSFAEFTEAGGKATDNCSIDPLSFRLISEVSDSLHCPETVTRVYQIADLCGNPDTCRQIILVEDKGMPTMTAPPDIFMNVSIVDLPPYSSLEEFIQAGGQVDDNCIIDSSSFLLFTEQIISGNCPDTIVRTYSVSDICQNRITCKQTIYISDPSLPQLESPRSLSYSCFSEVPQPYSDIVTFLQAGGDVKDNYKLDSSSFRMSWTDTLGICPTVLERTYEVADWCGNWEKVKHEIVIHDIEPPQMSCPPFSFFLCNHQERPEPFSTFEEFLAAGGTITDNCGIDPASFEFIAEIVEGECPVSIYRTYRIQDLCGNSTTCQQFIRGEKNCPSVNCYSNLTLTLGLDCEIELDPGMFLTNPFIPLVFEEYVWFTTTVNEIVIPDNTLRFEHVGKDIKVKINANLPGCGNSTCESRITLLLEDAPFIENTLKRTVYCTDELLLIDPESEEYPKPNAFSSCGLPVEGPEYVSEWIEFYECPLGDQDTTKIIYREWEAFSKEGVRTAAFDTIIVLRLPPVSMDNVWCPPADTIYCGEEVYFGPFMIIPDADPGDGESLCDTVYFLDHMGYPLLFDDKCRLITHVTRDTFLSENNCEFLYKYRLEIKQDCYGSPEMQCESLQQGDFSGQNQFEITGEIGIDPLYLICEFYIHDLDTTPPLVVFTTDDHFTEILTEDADCDEDNDKIYVISSDRGSCEAYTYLPPVCVFDDCRGVKTVKARIEDVGTFLYQEGSDTCYFPGDTSFVYNSTQQIRLLQRGTPYKVIIEATDQCHLFGYDTCFIWVKDESRPVAVADEEVILNLTTKKAWVDAETFNEGSRDNCGISLILARRDNWQEACIDLCYNHKNKTCYENDSVLVSALTPIWNDGNDTLWCIDLEEYKKCDSVEFHYAGILEWLKNDFVPGGHLIYNSWQYSLIKYASQICKPVHYYIDDDYIHELIVNCAKEGALDDKFLSPAYHPKIHCPGDDYSEEPIFGFNGLTDAEIELLLSEYAQLGGGWSNKVPFECADRCSSKEIDLLVVDFWGNWGRTRSEIWIEDRTPIAIEKTVPGGQISCKSFREKKWRIGNTIGLSLEDVAILARNGNQDANLLLDQVFGSYWKVWKDNYGNLIDSEGNVITDEDCLIDYQDFYCSLRVDTQRISKYDPEHDLKKWVTVYDTTVIYDTTINMFQNGLVSVTCDVECSSETWIDISDCGDGAIYRTFKIWPGCEQQKPTDTIVRHQKIAVYKTCPLQKAMFDLPNDTLVYTCDLRYGDDGTLSGDLDPEFTGKVVYDFHDDCRIVGMAYNDNLIKVLGTDHACYKLIRTWYLSDWCSGEPGYDDWWTEEPYSGNTIQYTQNILIRDTTAPTCILIPLKNPIVQTGGCDYDFEIPVLVEDPCGVESYNWTLYKEPGIFFRSGDGQLPRLENQRFEIAIPDLPDGNYTLKVRIVDACNNESICNYLFEVRVIQKPKAICISELTASLTPQDINGDGVIDSASVRVWAQEFNQSSEPVCGSTEPLEYRLDLLDGEADFDWEDDTTFLDLGCQNLGMQFLRLWVIDPQGRADYCDVILHVQDQNNICLSLGNLVDLQSRIVTEHFREIQGVTLKIADPAGHILYQNIYNGGLENMLIPRGKPLFIDLNKTDNPKKGVSTADLLLIQKHIQYLKRIESPYRLRAADANNDGSVSTIDLITIRKVILGIINEFPHSPAWRFYGPDISNTPYQLGPMYDDTTMIFTGVKIGDVNLDYEPGDGGYRNNDLLELLTSDLEMYDGREYKLSFYATNFINIEGFQFTLSFDPGSVDLIAVDPGTLSGLAMQNFGLNRMDQSVITVSWHNSDRKFSSYGISLPLDNVLFDLTIRANRDIRLNEITTINSTVTKAEAYGASNEVMGIGLSFTLPSKNPEFTLYQNYPNPFSESTTIGFELPEPGNACLTIFDITGKVIRRICGTFPGGYNSVSYRQENPGIEGILFYQLDNEEYSATRRMILIE